MKISGSQLSTSVAAAISLALCSLNLASAHPFHHKIRPCQSDNVAAHITCGDAARVEDCITHTGADEAHLESCLAHAGCAREQAQVEAAWAATRCTQNSGDVVEEVIIELREVQIAKRETTTTEESSSTSTSAATTSSSSSESVTTTASSTDSTSSSATSTASSSSSSSSTASSTSSSTASSTSSTSTSTSTSSSSSSSAADFGAWSYIIAAVMGIYVFVCMGCICYRCCAERNARKKALRLADEKEALALMKK